MTKTLTLGDYMFNNFSLSRLEPRAPEEEEEEEEPSIVMVHNPQDHQLPHVPTSSQAPLPLTFQPAKAPQKWRVRRRSSADIR